MDFKFKVAKAMSILPDKVYLSLIYAIRMKRRINWRNPKAFTEKLQWIKLYDRNPLYVQLVDKYEMKKYVNQVIGEGHTVPTLGVWDTVGDIDFSKLPERFVIKGTHDSGSVLICTDRDSFDEKEARAKLQASLDSNLYYLSREWPYKQVPHRIIAEEYIETKDKSLLTEYKLFCFNGEVKMVLICKGEANSNRRTNDFCDVSLNRLPFTSLYPNSQGEIKKPDNYDELLRYASELSKGIREVRVDAYVFDDKIYFGELTFFHCSGLRRYEPEEWDYKIGEWLELPEKR